jgi:type IV pilus assembly protein PilY1
MEVVVKTMLRKIMLAVAMLLVCSAAPVYAEDIDLFLGSSGSGANILFVLDNSSNWSAANQNWPTDTEQPMAGWCGNDCNKQGYYELKALYKLISGTKVVDKDLPTEKVVFLLPEGLAVGLMMFNNSTSTRDGGYVRAAVKELGSGTGSHREFLMLTIERAIKNFNTETAASSVQYAAGLFDAYKYFGGYSNPNKTFPGNPAIASPTYQTVPVFGTKFWGDNDDDGTKVDMRAYDGADYKPIIDATNNCGRNYIILIGNGFPAKDDVTSSDMSEVLRKLNDPRSASPAAVAQLDMPAYTSVNVSGFQCQKSATCVNTNLPSAQAGFSKSASYCSQSGGGLNCEFAVSFSCAKSDCTGQNLRVVASGTPKDGGVVQPTNNDLRYADEFAKFIASSDVSAQSGEQSVSIFPIDVFRAQPDARQTQLMRSIANYGNGEYYSASDYEQLKTALEDIVRKINAVNSVFASASLPVSATNRAQNENQVFIGLFRPDSELRPRWPGNLKRYQIAEINSKLALGDVNGRDAINTLTGFIDDCAVSYWTKDKGAYWNGIVSDSAVSLSTACTLRPLAGNSTYDVKSDFPDGPSVEKGAVSQVVRLGNDPTATNPTYSPSGRKVYTLDASNAVIAVPAPTVDSQKFALGYDVNNQRPGGDSTSGSADTSDVRPSVHGDVIHSRPLPVNFSTTACTNSDPTTCPEPDVVVFYGANDGMLRAVDAKTGKEIWSFISSDEYSASAAKMARLKDNAPMVLYPQVAYQTGENPKPKDYFFDGSSTAYQDISGTTDVRLFIGMRRGGRYVYAFDVSHTLDANAANRKPSLLWKFGCSASGTCTPGATDIAQTWSTPVVVKVKTKGNGTGPESRLVVAFGGGYDGGFDTTTSTYRCEDQDTPTPTGCDTNPKGRSVYILDAGPQTGGDGLSLSTLALPTGAGSVAADISFVDVDYDGYVDYGYAVDTRGNIYRITLRAADGSPLVKGVGNSAADWSDVTIHKVAYTNVPDADGKAAGRKFLFAPSVLAIGSRVYVAVGSGDRERPLRLNYPYQKQIKNRFYVFLDDLDNRAVTGNPNTPVAYNLDGSTMYDASLTNGNADCTYNRVVPGQTTMSGWYLDLAGQDADSVPPLWEGDVHRGEQVVTSALIAGGVVYFSTNSPDGGSDVQCTNNLGIARGYALNLLNGSGALGESALVCGGNNYGEFVGGGLPPSPVLGRVAYKYTTDSNDSSKKNPVVGTICIGCIGPGPGKDTIINPTPIKPPIKAKRNKIYWYNNTDKRTQ